MRVLIVDDNRINRKLLCAILETQEFTVFTAGDGIEALNVLATQSVDAIISDILMPRMDGYRLCLEVRKSDKLKTIPFIVYTSTYTSPADEKTAMDLGADKFLKKPAPATAIVQALRDTLNGVPRRDPHALARVSEPEVLEQYNTSLVAKLEQKNAELEMQTQAMQKVQDQISLQAAALEAAANAIFITDCAGTICWVNPAFCAMTGYASEEARGQNPRILRAGEQEVYDELWKTILSGQTWRGKLSNRRKDGSIFIGEHTVTPVRSGDGTIGYFVAIMNDITAQQRLEEQFIQAQKMEVVGHLAGGVAHDFNNILGVIMGYASLVLETSEINATVRRYVDEIRHSGERAAALTRQLLVFSRKQTLQPTVLDLNEAIRSLERMLRRLIDENIQLVFSLDNDAGRVKADSGYLGQVIMNLAINARDAMPDGGKITIQTANITLEQHHALSRETIPPGRYVMFSVSDTGTGMSAEVKARLFEAFFTTKPKGKGTGLGLITCHTIVKQSGGYIEVDSELGQGTTFTIYLPRYDQPVDVAASGDQAIPSPRGTETILIVEDEPALRNLAASVLESHGYTVLRANNGKDGLSVARQHKGEPISLVVTDVIMPEMSGKLMAEWLKSTYPGLKVLFTSGYTDSALAHHGVLDAGVMFLAKPYTPGSLTRKVRDVLDDKI